MQRKWVQDFSNLCTAMHLLEYNDKEIEEQQINDQ